MKFHYLFLLLALAISSRIVSQPGNGLDFDGTNDMVVVSSVPSCFSSPSSNDFTIEAWVNPRSVIFARILFAQPSTTNYAALCTGNSNNIYLYVVVNGVNYSIATSANLPQNQWTHVAARWVGASNAITILFNGVVQAGANGGSSSTGTSGLMTLGTRPGGAQYFNGMLDEVRVWNVARSNCDIQSNMYNSINVSHPNLVANYNFNQGIAGGSNPAVTTLPDLTGTFNGALTNFALNGSTSNWVASTATVNTTGGVLGAISSTQAAGVCSGASYMFPDGSTQNNITAAVTQTSNLTSGTGCSTIIVTSLSVTAAPAISVSSGSICNGQSFVLSPSGAASYTVNGTGSNLTVSPNTTTSYTITGTNAGGCTSGTGAVATVSVSALPSVSVSSGAICSGESFTIVPSGASSYSINGAGSFTVNPTATTSYSVTGTSPEGCLSSTAAVSTVTVNLLPVVSVNNGTICSGESFTIVPSGASSYSINGAGSFTVNPTATTSYSVTGTSPEGCISSSAAVSTVTVHLLPVVSVNNGTICAGKSFTLIPSGASTYSIEGGNTAVSPGTSSTFTVTGVSAEGCKSQNTATASITVNSLPAVQAQSSRSVLCVGESATLTASGAQQYSWNNGNTSQSFTVSPANSTTYVVTGTSQEGCINTATLVQNVSICTGISQGIEGVAAFNLYPNPSSGRVILQSPSLSPRSEVRLFNAMGQLLDTFRAEGTSMELNLENYSPGLYFIRVTNDHTLLFEGQVIRQ